MQCPMQSFWAAMGGDQAHFALSHDRRPHLRSLQLILQLSSFLPASFLSAHKAAACVLACSQLCLHPVMYLLHRYHEHQQDS